MKPTALATVGHQVFSCQLVRQGSALWYSDLRLLQVRSRLTAPNASCRRSSYCAGCSEWWKREPWLNCCCASWTPHLWICVSRCSLNVSNYCLLSLRCFYSIQIRSRFDFLPQSHHWYSSWLPCFFLDSPCSFRYLASCPSTRFQPGLYLCSTLQPPCSRRPSKRCFDLNTEREFPMTWWSNASVSFMNSWLNWSIGLCGWG